MGSQVLNEFIKEGLAISQPALVSAFGPKAMGNLSAAEIQKMYQDLPGVMARRQAGDEIYGTHEGLIARSGKKDEDHRRLVEQRKAQGEKGGGIDIAFLQMIQDIETLRQQIAENGEKIAKLDKEIDVLETYRESLLFGEDIGLNADGTFEDPKLEKVISAWEAEYGKIDRNDPDAIFAIIEHKKDERREVLKETRTLSDSLADKEALVLKANQSLNLDAITQDPSLSPETIGVILADIDDSVGAVSAVNDLENVSEKDKEMLTRVLQEELFDASKSSVGSKKPFAKGEMSGSFEGAVAFEATEISLEPKALDNSLDNLKSNI